MPSIACLNGVFSAPEEVRVSIDDRGYVFGDGVYETLRCYENRIWALERHLTRLQRSLAEVEMANASVEAMRDWIQEAHRRSELRESIVYVQVTRGVAPRQHTFAGSLQPQVLVTVRPVEPISTSMRGAGAAGITVEDLRWARRDIKSINLLPNVMAKQAAHKVGAFEAILVEEDGRVTEGSSTNVFAVFGGVLRTHPADHHILGGVTRDLVIGLAHDAGLTVQEQPFTRDQLNSAEEIFLSGTTTEILGITRLDHSTVGNGQVGPLTNQLYQAFEECVRGGRDG